MKLLLYYLAIGLAAAESGSPLADAAEQGDRQAVISLLQRKAAIDAAQGDGMTAPHWPRCMTTRRWCGSCLPLGRM